jgi:FkbM family methyltransferase
MTSLIDFCAHCYFSSFPVERGKWRLWLKFLAFRNRKPPPTSDVRTIRKGIRMRVAPADYVGKFIYYWNCWEPNESWVVERILRPGDTFIDVGANIGYFALLASTIVGPNGKVVAFEPVPPTLEKLRLNLSLNDAANVTVIDCAVSDSVGVVRIYQPHDSNIGANSMRSSKLDAPSWDVRMATLSSELPQDLPVKLLKIDVEGAELKVLRGFTDHLQTASVPFVLCEVTESFLRDLGDSSRELFSLMASLGYQPHLLDNMRLTPFPNDSVGGETDNINVLFAKIPISKNCQH